MMRSTEPVKATPENCAPNVPENPARIGYSRLLFRLGLVKIRNNPANSVGIRPYPNAFTSRR